jgi:hypothetical protein
MVPAVWMRLLLSVSFILRAVDIIVLEFILTLCRYECGLYSTLWQSMYEQV